MSIRCPQCSREYDVTLFEFSRDMKCPCGNSVSLQHNKLCDESVILRRREEERIRDIRKIADKISFLIIGSDYPLIDIEIEKLKLKEKIYEFFPDRMHLYKLIYEARFKRLEEQFRNV